MESIHNTEKSSNKLLLWLIIFSIVVHIPIYLHMNGLLSSKVYQFIELNMMQEKKSSGRGIPRPPMMPKPVFQNESKINQIQAAPLQIPDVNPVMTGHGDTALSSNLFEGVSGLAKGEDYKEMVLRRIERVKKYPKDADGTYKEAVVSLSFIINPDGTVSNLKIVRPCPYNSLNHAALQAVKDSIPFPKPPTNIYKGGVLIPLNLSFELI
jgi:periplasmic protein TonB